MSLNASSRRVMFRIACIAFLIFVVWLADLNVGRSLLNKCLGSQGEKLWKIDKKGNFWKSGHSWLLVSAPMADYTRWRQSLQGLEFLSEEELNSMPISARSIKANLKSDWLKYMMAVGCGH